MDTTTLWSKIEQMYLPVSHSFSDPYQREDARGRSCAVQDRQPGRTGVWHHDAAPCISKALSASAGRWRRQSPFTQGLRLRSLRPQTCSSFSSGSGSQSVSGLVTHGLRRRRCRRSLGKHARRRPLCQPSRRVLPPQPLRSGCGYYSHHSRYTGRRADVICQAVSSEALREACEPHPGILRLRPLA